MIYRSIIIWILHSKLLKIRRIWYNSPKVKKRGRFMFNNKKGIFNYELIKLNANADKLFAKFLEAIEKEYGNDIPESFTIGEVVKRIPQEAVGIKKSESYHYALNALFGCQKGRKYFVFNNPTVQNEFTSEANNPLRDNRFWKNYVETVVKINPDYFI